MCLRHSSDLNLAAACLFSPLHMALLGVGSVLSRGPHGLFPAQSFRCPPDSSSLSPHPSGPFPTSCWGWTLMCVRG